MWRRKSVPARPGEERADEVHGRPRTRRGLPVMRQGQRTGGRDRWTLGAKRMPLGRHRLCHWFCIDFVFGFALPEPKALAIHLEHTDVMGQAVEERTGAAFQSEDPGPFIEKDRVEVTGAEPRS